MSAPAWPATRRFPANCSTGRARCSGWSGRTASGKTVYLTVLNQQLRDVVRRQFDADVYLRGDQQAGTHSVQEWLEQYERALFDRKQLLPPTPPGRRVPLVLQLRQEQRRRFRRSRLVSTILSFCDVAGEDLLTQPKAMRQPYLAAANGLIVLLDAWQIPKVRTTQQVPPGQEELRPLVQSVLSIVTDTLRDARVPEVRGKLATPIAVVVGKFDVVERLLPGPALPVHGRAVGRAGLRRAVRQQRLGTSPEVPRLARCRRRRPAHGTQLHDLPLLRGLLPRRGAGAEQRPPGGARRWGAAPARRPTAAVAAAQARRHRQDRRMTGFQSLYYTDCLAGEGLLGGAGFQFRAVSPGTDPRAMELVQRACLR